MFAHIFGPLTNDPFIKQFKIAPKAQPGNACLKRIKSKRKMNENLVAVGVGAKN